MPAYDVGLPAMWMKQHCAVFDACICCWFASYVNKTTLCSFWCLCTLLVCPGLQELWCAHQHHEEEAGRADANATQSQPPAAPGSSVARQHSAPPGPQECPPCGHGPGLLWQPAHHGADGRCSASPLCPGCQLVVFTCMCAAVDSVKGGQLVSEKGGHVREELGGGVGLSGLTGSCVRSWACGDLLMHACDRVVCLYCIIVHTGVCVSECESWLGCYTVNVLSELFPSGRAEMDLVACLEPVTMMDKNLGW